MQPFLDALTECGMVTASCDRAGISRSSLYSARDRDPEFHQAWEDVNERATEELEKIALKRAADQSDQLMSFMLRAKRPSVYRDNQRIEISGTLSLEQVLLSKPDDSTDTE